MPATAPSTREIGYVTPSYGTTNAWWQFDPDEDTPELQWPMSVKVYNCMRTQDAQVGSVLEAVTRPVLRTPWRLDPAGARDEVVEFVADDLGLPIVGKNPKPPPRTKDRFSWLEHLELALLMLPFGHMFFEQVYRVNKAGTVAHLGKLSPRMPRTIERIDVARDGGLISITQLGTLDQRGPQAPIPVAHLVAYVYKKEGGNWLGRSVLRQAYKNWLIKDRLLRVQAQTIERNGMGIPDYEAAESETDLTKGLGLATSLRAGEAAGVARPSGSKLRLMGVEGELPDALPVVKYHDEQIARAVLAHFLNLDTQSHGSYALGASFMDFFTLSLQTLAQSIADTATMHIVEDLVDANWGENEPAPRLVFDEIGSRQAATAEALKALVDAGILHPDEVLEESSRQQYGLPPADPATATTPPAPSGGVPQAPTPTGALSVAAGPGGAGPKAVAAQAATGGTDSAEDIADLFAAVGELEVWAAAFDPTKHARNPKGSPGGGRFKSMVERLGDSLQAWRAGDRKSDPFDAFSREQLRRVARARGIELKRGEDRDSIAKKLFDHLDGQGASKAKKPARDVQYHDLTPDAAQAMQDRMGEWTPEQAHALQHYSGGYGYKDVNSTLRGIKGRVYTPASPQQIQLLRDGMRPIPEDIVLHRYVNGDAFGLFGPVEGWAEAAHALVGRTWHDPAFTSTSILPRPGVVSLHISTPRGTRGAYIQSLTHFEDEHEMLLDAGTHFRVDRFERGKHGWDAYMTVVGQDD